MSNEYSPYEYRKGKEYIVQDEETGERFCGKYILDLIDDKDGISIGFYNDPVRGEEVATLSKESLFRGVCITGCTGYGKSTVLKNIIEQVKSDFSVVDIDLKGTRNEDKYDVILEDFNPESMFNYNDIGDFKLEILLKQIGCLFNYNSVGGAEYSNVLDELERSIEDESVSSFEEVIKFLDDKDYESCSRSIKAFQEINKENNNNDLSKHINENKSILIKPRNLEMRGIVATLFIGEIMKASYKDSNKILLSIDPVPKVINSFDHLDYALSFDDFISKSRSLSIACICVLQDVGMISDKALADLRNNIENWILFRETKDSIGQRTAQILEMSKKDLAELKNYEAYMKPVTPDDHISEIVVKCETFPEINRNVR